jgi:hypothetical protein
MLQIRLQFCAEKTLDRPRQQGYFCTVDTNEIANDDFSSQLRSLRLLLGKNYRPISTTTLASVTGVHATAIQAVEAGRRQLNDKDRENIADFAGARWNESTHQWTFVGNPELPYTRSIYEKLLKGGWVISGDRTEKNAETLVKSIHTLLRVLRPRDAVLATRDLLFEIERIAKENNITPDWLKILQANRSSLIVFPHDPEEIFKEPEATPVTKKVKTRG